MNSVVIRINHEINPMGNCSECKCKKHTNSGECLCLVFGEQIGFNTSDYYQSIRCNEYLENYKERIL